MDANLFCFAIFYKTFVKGARTKIVTETQKEHHHQQQQQLRSKSKSEYLKNIETEAILMFKPHTVILYVRFVFVANLNWSRYLMRPH